MGIMELHDKAYDDRQNAALKRERDELAAHNKILLDALTEIRSMPCPVDGSVSHDRPIFKQWVKTNGIADSALSIAQSAALKEIRAQVLEEAVPVITKLSSDIYGVTLCEHEEVAGWLTDMAASERKGE